MTAAMIAHLDDDPHSGEPVTAPRPEADAATLRGIVQRLAEGRHVADGRKGRALQALDDGAQQVVGPRAVQRGVQRQRLVEAQGGGAVTVVVAGAAGASEQARGGIGQRCAALGLGHRLGGGRLGDAQLGGGPPRPAAPPPASSSPICITRSPCSAPGATGRPAPSRSRWPPLHRSMPAASGARPPAAARSPPTG